MDITVIFINESQGFCLLLCLQVGRNKTNMAITNATGMDNFINTYPYEAYPYGANHQICRRVDTERITTNIYRNIYIVSNPLLTFAGKHDTPE